MSKKDQLSPRLVKKLKHAEGLVQQHNFKRAERILDEVRGALREPYPLPVLQVQGLLAFQRKQYEPARKIFKSVWERDKRSPVAHLYLGRIYRKLRQLKLSLMFLENGVAIKPDDDSLRSEQIQTLLELNRASEASELVDAWISEGEPGAQLVNAAASVKRQTGELPRACELYRQSLGKLIQQPPRPDNSQKDAEGDFDVERHEDTLWEVLAQLKAAGVQAFPYSGTLLGLVRDGQLLPFDKDVDLGIPFNQMKAAAACMKANGWREINNSFGLSSPRAFSHPKKGLAIDVFAFFYDADTDTTQTGFVMKGIPFEWSYLQAYPKLELEVQQSPHGAVWGLKRPEEFLEALYGPGWRYPDPYFAAFGGEHNLVSFSYLTQCYAYIRLFKHWQSGSFMKMHVLLHHMLRYLPDDEVLQRAKQVIDQHLDSEKKRQEKERAVEEKEQSVVH